MEPYEYVADLARDDSDLRVAAAIQARQDRAANRADTTGRDAVGEAEDRFSDRRDRAASRRDAIRLAELDHAGSSAATTSVLLAVAQAATLRTMAALDRRAAADDRSGPDTGATEASLDLMARAERELGELDRDRRALRATRGNRSKDQA